MLEMLSRIPDSVGWALVGALAVLVVIAGIAVGKIFREVWRDYKEDREENENFFEYVKNNY